MSPPYRYCPSCGSKYGHDRWPRACDCGATIFRNPAPVVVLLQPIVGDDGSQGLLLIRRADPPYTGGLALPGGFMEFGEAWRQAAAREAREECGVIVDPAGIDTFGIESIGGIVLLFGLARPQRAAELPAFEGNPEVSERLITYAAPNLVFPLHTTMAARYFALHGR